MVLALGSDHAGFKLKEVIKKYLIAKEYSVEDLGTYSEECGNYPDYAFKVAESVAKGSFDLGILVCGTGIGMSIAANKVKGIRAAVCDNIYNAHTAKEINNANILCLGERVIGEEVAKEIVDTWLNSSFEGGRQLDQLRKIQDYELDEYKRRTTKSSENPY